MNRSIVNLALNSSATFEGITRMPAWQTRSQRRSGSFSFKACCLAVGLAICMAPSLELHAEEWIESSFEDFRDGSFSDGGANAYVSARGRIQTVNRWDVNRDGYIDLFFVNSHPLIEMLDMSIYWGNGKDFSIRNHSYVPVNGPMWVTPGDLNGDKQTDLVVANYSNGTWTQMDSAVYWGRKTAASGSRQADEKTTDPSPFSSQDRTYLPSQNCQKAALGDFNRDGFVDIVFAFSGGFWEYRARDAKGAPSRIYWNSKDGFHAEKFSDLLTLGATDVAVADFNQDGYADIVFANAEPKSSSYVYFGSQGDFSNNDLIELPTSKPHAVEVGDVNNDGLPDIVFAHETGPHSVAYLNKNGRFSPDARIEFATYWAKDCVVEDFNRDGHADVFFTNHQHSLSGDPLLANRLINSFLYWGSKDGFTADNKLQLQTIGAWGAEGADLNNDGWTDLVVCNFQEHYSYEVPSFIYWNGPQGFSVSRRTPLYEHGAQGCSIADLNGDGHLDLAMTSMMGGSRGDYDPCWLYLGDAQGTYSKERRIALPGREGYEQAMGDLDDDGQVDLILMNQGEVTRSANEAFIYWNEKGSFHPWRMSGLPAFKGLGVQIADLDKDGYIDVIVSNYAPEPGGDGKGPGTTVYWGSQHGFVVTERTSVPILQSRSPCVADMNGDGHLDLVFGQERLNLQVQATAAIFYGDGSRQFTPDRRTLIPGAEDTGQPEVADLNRDGRLDIAYAGEQVKVYYGDAQGKFDEQRKQVVKVQAKTMNVADVDNDGWLDLVCPLYKSGSNRTGLSSVLRGGPDGYDLGRRIELPTDGGTGAVISDFNFDGHTDCFLWCHRHDGSHEVVGRFGDHATDSFLYYGSANGFSTDRRLGIPGIGVHYDVGADIGDVRTRKFQYDYVSSPYRAAGRAVRKISWQADTPAKTAVRFQLRSASDREGLAAAAWQGPNGADSYFTAPAAVPPQVAKNEWVQYRAVLDTVNGAESPVVSEVRVSFE